MMTKINLIDIGSVGGFDIPWSFNTDKIEYSLSFEPNDQPILNSKNLRYNSAIWNFDGEANFYVSGHNGTGSSLLKQNFTWVNNNFDAIKNNGNKKLNQSWFERSKITNEFKCQVKKLDTVLSEIHAAIGEDIKFHFLKSDTQSGEYYVLEGAENFLKTDCLGLELELYRYPLYENIILEQEVKDYLRSLGFFVAGWTGYKNSFESQADYLFLKKEAKNQEEQNIIDLIKEVYKPQRGGIIKHRSLLQKVTAKLKMNLK
ncbi:hypothetical protein B6N60_04095 [Richelia sinica FACHB-800]|uniref:Methyltransferase FkbM domain-containing protein n=1 Tax=Richelia sinica FACHB-800 TaxID=1357546 RepID=A0A975Y6K3_9NOST|nr:FkbM family methyltransferase [Richelia sinica]MBD2664823.1 FkbM family methyltransferase [Richelia sinica FACHB-800]QXE25380.1 hypothetical protein B6N60_04095 [Richelia sinica FACHB-800]